MPKMPRFRIRKKPNPWADHLTIQDTKRDKERRTTTFTLFPKLSRLGNIRMWRERTMGDTFKRPRTFKARTSKQVSRVLNIRRGKK